MAAAAAQHAPPLATFEMRSVPPGTRLTLTLPDDFHHHFRDGPKVPDVLRLATQRFGRAIAMPNLQPVSNVIRRYLHYSFAVSTFLYILYGSD